MTLVSVYRMNRRTRKRHAFAVLGTPIVPLALSPLIISTNYIGRHQYSVVTLVKGTLLRVTLINNMDR